VEELGQGVLFWPCQRREERPQRGKAPPKQVLTKGSASLGEIERDCASIAAFAPLDQAIRDESVYEAHRTWVRQAEHAPQLIV
jgi:hypothetical protein